MDQSNLKKNLISEADQCVKCGFCLPVCPTYALTKHEAESPRGRINAIRELANTPESLTAQGLEYLENCLQCNACTSRCPSNVKYNQLISNYPLLIKNYSSKTPLISKLLIHNNSLQLIKCALKLFYCLKNIFGNFQLLKHFLAKSSTLSRLPDKLSFTALKPYYPTNSIQPDTVAIFLGCADKLLSEEAMLGSTHLLNLLGYDVFIPKEQRCCGALSMHQGCHKKAQQLLDYNQRQFSKIKSLSYILTFSSGCQSFLQNQDKKSQANKTIDIIEFLSDKPYHQYLSTQSKKLKIGLYIPCTQRNILKNQNKLIEFIASWPNVDCELIHSPYACCGSSATKMLTQPQRAGALLEPIVQQVAQIKYDLVLTTNIGCQLHIRSGLAKAGIQAPVMHPLAAIKAYFIK